MPNASLAGKYFLVIEGDAGDAGTIDQKIDLSSYSFGSNGLLLIRATTQLPTSGATSVVNINFSPDLENGTGTFIIMDCPTQAVGTDLDTNNDGILDGAPFTGKTIYDAVSVTDGGGTDRMYATSLSGTNMPVKPGTSSTGSDAFFREGGILYGAQLKDAPPGTSTPSDNQIAVEAAWSAAGVLNPNLANRIFSNGNTPSPLPVTLTSFASSTLGQEVILDWTTTDESNFRHFSVERSFDPRNGFEAIGRIDARAVTTIDKTTYRFVDHNSQFRVKLLPIKASRY